VTIDREGVDFFPFLEEQLAGFEANRKINFPQEKSKDMYWTKKEERKKKKGKSKTKGRKESL
jgi:hypothetical protein